MLAEEAPLVSLSDLGQLYCGQSPPSTALNGGGRGWPYITGPEAWDGHALHATKWVEDPPKTVPEGCIFVTVKGAGVGKLFKGIACAIGRDVYAFKPHPEVDEHYVLWALRSVIEAVKIKASGDIPGLSKDDILGHDIPLFAVERQLRIVAKLDTLQSRTRIAHEALAAIPILLDHYRQSILAAAFRGELSEQYAKDKSPNRPAHDEAQIAKVKRGYQPPNELPELTFPERWQTWIAAEVVAPGNDIVYGIVQPGPEIPGGVPYVRGMDIQDGSIAISQLKRTSPEIAQRYARASLREGDVLLGIIRATKVAIVPSELDGANITQGTARFRPSSAIRTDFLAHFLSSPLAQAWLHAHYRGIDMPGLNLADVRMLPIPVPSLREQAALSKRLDSALHWIDNVARLVTSLQASATSFDQSLLATAFRGELVPQDPTDEPASVLLDRIRATRAQAGDAPRTRRPRAPVAASAPARAAEPTPRYRAAAGHDDSYATVLTALRAHGSLASADAQAATGLDAAVVRPLLQRLVAEGHARIAGQKRGTHYIAIHSGAPP